MTITDAIYLLSDTFVIGEDRKVDRVKATIDGEIMFIPLVEDNRHYIEIMRRVAEGTLIIEPANEVNP